MFSSSAVQKCQSNSFSSIGGGIGIPIAGNKGPFPVTFTNEFAPGLYIGSIFICYYYSMWCPSVFNGLILFKYYVLNSAEFLVSKILIPDPKENGFCKFCYFDSSKS